MVAPGRFELPSQDPESRMIDRYTRGLVIPPNTALFLILFVRDLGEIGRPGARLEKGLFRKCILQVVFGFYIS